MTRFRGSFFYIAWSSGKHLTYFRLKVSICGKHIISNLIREPGRLKEVLKTHANIPERRGPLQGPVDLSPTRALASLP